MIITTFNVAAVVRQENQQMIPESHWPEDEVDCPPSFGERKWLRNR